VLQQGDIQYKGVSMKSAFSQQEYDVLSALLKSESKPLTRDEIADIIWGSHADEQYSVWAIEQLIRRIRTKLERMGLLGMHINNKRSVGYYIPSTQ
jgi:DNA-binding response OmpR family regulator